MKVGLFIPCYINAVYPEVGVASYKLLKSLGVDVDYPLDQTCCGQPMANAGFEGEAKELAKRFDRLFERYDYIVGPSASCVVFVRDHYGNLLAEEPHRCASEGKIYDICEFIHDVVKPVSIAASFPHKVSIQNSCHGVRLMHLSSPSELNIPYYNKLEGHRDCRTGTSGRVLRIRGYVCRRRARCVGTYGTRQGAAAYRYGSRIHRRGGQFVPDAPDGHYRT